MRLKVWSVPAIHLTRFVSVCWKVQPRCGWRGNQDKSPGLLPRSGKLLSFAIPQSLALNKPAHLTADRRGQRLLPLIETQSTWFCQFHAEPSSDKDP
jgi:hypothetical protein